MCSSDLIAGVVAVHDVGQDGASHFIVSDFVDGETLADQMKRDRLSCRVSARIIADIAETLHRAHLQDIVHRDVKPNNILIDKSGTVFLTDFGLAINEVEQLAESEAVLGTFAYMPPEQAFGKVELVDERADDQASPEPDPAALDGRGRDHRGREEQRAQRGDGQAVAPANVAGERARERFHHRVARGDRRLAGRAPAAQCEIAH